MEPTGAGLILGAAAAFAVSGTAWRVGALTTSGAVAAAVVGSVVMGIGGIPFAAPLVAFFVTSSAWSRWRSARQDRTAVPRTALQVIANGGVAAGIAVSAMLVPALRGPSPRDWFLLYLAAVGFACADTWATEIGSKLASRAWLLTSGKWVSAGESGGISFPGSLGAVAGALVVVATGWAFWSFGSPSLQWRMDAAEALAVMWAALVATLLDTILGGALQGQYRCERCRRIVEESAHCGGAAAHVRGVRWLGNNSVNFIGSAASVLCAWYLLKAYAWPI